MAATVIELARSAGAVGIAFIFGVASPLPPGGMHVRSSRW
jgi:hypothetical protein